MQTSSLRNVRLQWDYFLDLASRALCGALNARFSCYFDRYPRLRYVVGWDALFLWRPLSLLPPELQDFILNAVYRFENEPKPIGATN